MGNCDARVQDIIDNCEVLLTRMSIEVQIDATPAGCMMSQLKWLKERAEAGELTLPVDPAYTASLRYIFTDGALSYLCGSQEAYENEIKRPLYRLMGLATEGCFLLKPAYYPYAARCLDKLIALLRSAPRPLSAQEQGSIAEIEQLKERLLAGEIEPPLMSWREYPSFNEVYYIFGSSIDDLPEGKETCRLVADLIFEGERPASWTTPEVADRETREYARY